MGLISSFINHSAEDPPYHEEKAESDDGPYDERVLPLLEVDLLDEVVDEREAVGDVVQLGAHCLVYEKNVKYVYQQLRTSALFDMWLVGG